MDPQDQQELNKLYEKYIELLQRADGLTRQQAQAQADQVKAAGNLTTSISRLNKELSDTVFKSDYLYQSFQETTAELKKQNVLLQAGKSIFKGLTTLSSDLNYFQQGITDLTGKQLKRKGEILAKNELELTNVRNRLGEEKEINGVRQFAFKQEKLLNDLYTIGSENLTASQKKLLDQLKQEKELFDATNNALSEGLPLLKKELDISKQIYDVREDLGGMATAAAGVVSKYGGSLAQFLNVDDAIDSVKQYNQSLISDALKSKEVIEQIKNIEDQRIALLQNSLIIQKEITKLTKDLEDATNAVQITQDNNNQIQEIQNQLATQQNLTLVEKQQLQDEIKRLQDESLRVQNLANNGVNIQNELLAKQNDLLNDELNTKQQLADLDKEEDKVKQDAINSVNNLGNKFKSLGVLVKGLGTGLKKALTDPLTIITFFIDKALDANKQAVELGKSLGYGNDRAEDFRENMADIVSNSNNLNVTSANLVEAFGQLSEATGLSYEFTADQLETQIKLTKQVGLQADEAAQIQRFAVLNGKTSEETYKSFVKGLATTRNQLKVGINFKAALAEATKISGQLAANLGNNPETIAKAVVTAKAFGMTLDQVAKSGESLLNFESSIESELKAELLTGKQLNLERARAAALAGDQITLAEELNKNIGSSAEFTKMNVLQQKALAESVGMTSDELANTLRKREEAIKSGKSLAQVTAEEAAEALERQTIQDKFNQAILKLQDLIGNLVAGPLAMFIDGLSMALQIVNFITKPLQWMADLSKYIGETISGWANALGPFGILLKGIAGIAILLAGYGAYAALSWIPVVGPVLGAVAAAAVIGKGFSALSSQKADDMVSEGGYGKRTLLSPEGAIKLNDKDTVLAGTDLGGGTPNISGPSIDLTPMIAAINEVKAAVDGLMNRPVIINMDSKQVGSNLVQGSYKLA